MLNPDNKATCGRPAPGLVRRGRAFHRTRRGQIQQITCGQQVRCEFQISKGDFWYESLQDVSTPHWAGARARRSLGKYLALCPLRPSAIRKSLLDDQSALDHALHLHYSVTLHPGPAAAQS